MYGSKLRSTMFDARYSTLTGKPRKNNSRAPRIFCAITIGQLLGETHPGRRGASPNTIDLQTQTRQEEDSGFRGETQTSQCPTRMQLFAPTVDRAKTLGIMVLGFSLFYLYLAVASWLFFPRYRISSAGSSYEQFSDSIALRCCCDCESVPCV